MLLRIVLVIFLSLGTILFSVIYPQYEVFSEELLQNPMFQENLLNWQVQNKDSVSLHNGILILSDPVRNSSRTTAVAQTLAVPSGQRLLFLSCEARTQDVSAGAKPWETARVLLVPLTAEGKPRHDVPHSLASLNGTMPWARYEHIFRVPEENAAVSVVVQLLNASGTLEVRSLTLRSAIVNPAYSKWRQALILAWLMAGVWIVWPLARAAHRHTGRTGVLVIGSMLLAGILIPASVKYALTPAWLLPERESLDPFRADLLDTSVPFRLVLLPLELNIYKLAHITLFALIGYLLILRRPYAIPIKAQVGILTLFALATESMQVLASGRDGSLSDVLIDMFGACCGLLAAAVTLRYYSRKPIAHD